MNKGLIWIALPSFPIVADLELVVFAFVDLQDLHWLRGNLEVSRQTTYTAEFFCSGVLPH